MKNVDVFDGATERELSPRPAPVKAEWTEDEVGEWEAAQMRDATWVWGVVATGLVLLAGSLYACYRWLV